MKFLNKANFEAKLRRRFPDHCDGWLYNCLEQAFGCEAYTISARAKLDTLITKTQRIVLALHSIYPLCAFPNGVAGWRGVPQNRRRSPVELPDAEQLSQLLRDHLYFRDPGRHIDNYHVTDQHFRWIAVFCHHDDWHFYAPPHYIARAKNA